MAFCTKYLKIPLLPSSKHIVSLLQIRGFLIVLGKYLIFVLLIKLNPLRYSANDMLN